MALRLLLDPHADATLGPPRFLSRARAWDADALSRGAAQLRAQVHDVVRERLGRDADVPGEWVLHLRDRARFTMASLAAWAEGVFAVAPAHAHSPAMRRAAQGEGLIVTDDASTAHELGKAALVLHLSEAWCSHGGGSPNASSQSGLAPAPDPLTWRGLDDAEVAWVFETSGSRGEPTLHPRSARALDAEAKVLAALLELEPARVLVGTVPPTHLYGALFTVVAPLHAGVGVVCESPLHAGEILAALRETRASVLVSTPAHLAALLASSEAELASWAAEGDLAGARPFDVVSSGAALPTALAQRLARLPNVRLTEILGATETGGIAYRRGAEVAYQPLPGVRCRVDQETLEVASPWCGDAVGGWVPTQEQVELTADGRFTHHGRRDDVVKVGGRRIRIGALEEALRAAPGVVDVALAANPVEGPRGVEIIGVVVAPGVSAEDLVARLRERFDPVVVPRRLRHVVAIARDERGKLSSEHVIDVWRRAPQTDFLLGVRATNEAAELVLQVPPTTAWTHGHFRGDPTVPGAALLAAIAEAVEAMDAGEALDTASVGELRRVRGAKFHAKVAPGDNLHVRVLRGVDRDPAAGSDRATPRRASRLLEVRRGDTLVLRAELVLGGDP